MSEHGLLNNNCLFSSSRLSLFMSASAPGLFDFTPQFPRLEVVDADDQRSIFLNGHLAARYSCDDKGTERVVVTQLAEVLALPDRQIAAAFNLHPVTVSRLRGLVREGGSAALLPLKPGPKGPSKMTPKLEARCRSLRADGASLRSIAKQVSTAAKKISYVTVASLFRADSAPPSPPGLPLEAEVPPEIAPAPAATFGESRSTRYAGAMLLFAALARLDVWSVFQSLGATTGPARRFGWAQTVAAIVFCFTLRFRSIEDWKNGRRQDLGVLIGEPGAPSVLSLRTKIKELTESIDPVAFSRAMFQRYLALEPVWEGLYYVDGHFCPYYGEHPTPRAGIPSGGWQSRGTTTCISTTPRAGRCSSFPNPSTTRWGARSQPPSPRSAASMASSPSRWCSTGEAIAGKRFASSKPKASASLLT